MKPGPIPGGHAAAFCSAVHDRLAAVDGTVLTLRAGELAQHQFAGSSPWAHRVEELQVVTGQGPSLSAFATGEPALAEDLTRPAAEWLEFAEAARALGARAAFSFPLLVAEANLGTLTCYRREPGRLSPGTLAELAVFAQVSTYALFADGAATIAEHIRTDIGENDVNVAVGMLAVDANLTVEDAYAQLRAVAYSSGRSLSEVARETLERHEA